jgi:hypothetical protein
MHPAFVMQDSLFDHAAFAFSFSFFHLAPFGKV